jgi:hypothetical protein
LGCIWEESILARRFAYREEEVLEYNIFNSTELVEMMISRGVKIEKSLYK